MAHEEMFQSISKVQALAPVFNERDCRQLLRSLVAETKNEGAYNWPAMTLLARKPGASNV
jgi:hypothetical protein